MQLEHCIPVVGKIEIAASGDVPAALVEAAASEDFGAPPLEFAAVIAADFASAGAIAVAAIRLGLANRCDLVDRFPLGALHLAVAAAAALSSVRFDDFAESEEFGVDAHYVAVAAISNDALFLDVPDFAAVFRREDSAAIPDAWLCLSLPVRFFLRLRFAHV